MSILNRFMEYYEAFERFYDNNDRNEIAEYFTNDIVYESPTSGKVEGLDAVIKGFSNSLVAFDKLFPIKRDIVILDEGKEATDNYVRIPGDCFYRIPNGPTLKVYMVEEVWYEGDKIKRIVDTFEPAERQKIATFMVENQALLGQ